MVTCKSIPEFCGPFGECQDRIGEMICTCNSYYTGRRCQYFDFNLLMQEIKNMRGNNMLKSTLDEFSSSQASLVYYISYGIIIGMLLTILMGTVMFVIANKIKKVRKSEKQGNKIGGIMQNSITIPVTHSRQASNIITVPHSRQHSNLNYSPIPNISPDNLQHVKFPFPRLSNYSYPRTINYANSYSNFNRNNTINHHDMNTTKDKKKFCDKNKCKSEPRLLDLSLEVPKNYEHLYKNSSQNLSKIQESKSESNFLD